MFEQYRFDALEDLGGLHGMGAGAELEIDVRRGNAHLAEENIGKGGVVVLAGVHQDGIDLRVALHFAHERRNLREIGTCTYDVDNFHWGAHEFVKCGRGWQYSI